MSLHAWSSRLRRAVLVASLVAASAAHAGAYEDFFTAVTRDDAGAVRQLLQRGMDPNSRDPDGQSALFLALRGGAFRVAGALLAERTLDIDAVNAHDESALMIAALKGHLEWVRRLLERGARVDKPGWSALHYAATGPGPGADVVALLLARGATVDARSPNRTTPLMMAAQYGSEASVDLLLARGADPKARNDRDLGPAEFARLAGREALAGRLEALAR